MNPDLDLSSVEAKFKWARRHYEAVHGEIHDWLQGSKNSLLVQHNEDFTQHYLQAVMPGPKPDFIRWSLMLGDCITNLRGSLDHLVTAIANLPTSPRPDKRDKAAFLIQKCLPDFTDTARGKLVSVPDPVREAILSFQPFNRPHQHLPPLLGILAELANGNKHRILNVAINSPALFNVQFISASGKRQKGTYGINERNIEDGTTVLVFEVPEPDPSIYLDQETAKLHFEMTLKHLPKEGRTDFGADRTPYRILLEWIFAEVRLAIDEVAAAT